MKNQALITKIITKVINKKNSKLSLPIIINDNDIKMKITELVEDDNEWCITTESGDWVIPLEELTNRELLILYKAI